jgi:hypothetical protein
MQRFDCIVGGSLKCAKTAHSLMTSSTGVAGTQCSIKGACDDEEAPKRIESSLNKNLISTPKNMRRLTLFKGNMGTRNTGFPNSAM